jgi:hypothetical protein
MLSKLSGANLRTSPVGELKAERAATLTELNRAAQELAELSVQIEEAERSADLECSLIGGSGAVHGIRPADYPCWQDCKNVWCQNKSRMDLLQIWVSTDSLLCSLASASVARPGPNMYVPLLPRQMETRLTSGFRDIHE